MDYCQQDPVEFNDCLKSIANLVFSDLGWLEADSPLISSLAAQNCTGEFKQDLIDFLRLNKRHSGCHVLSCLDNNCSDLDLTDLDFICRPHVVCKYRRTQARKWREKDFSCKTKWGIPQKPTTKCSLSQWSICEDKIFQPGDRQALFTVCVEDTRNGVLAPHETHLRGREFSQNTGRSSSVRSTIDHLLMEFLNEDEHFLEFERVFDIVKNQRSSKSVDVDAGFSSSGLGRLHRSPEIGSPAPNKDADQSSFFDEFFDNDESFLEFEEEFEKFRSNRRSNLFERLTDRSLNSGTGLQRNDSFDCGATRGGDSVVPVPAEMAVPVCECEVARRCEDEALKRLDCISPIVNAKFRTRCRVFPPKHRHSLNLALAAKDKIQFEQKTYSEADLIKCCDDNPDLFNSPPVIAPSTSVLPRDYVVLDMVNSSNINLHDETLSQLAFPSWRNLELHKHPRRPSIPCHLRTQSLRELRNRSNSVGFYARSSCTLPGVLSRPLKDMLPSSMLTLPDEQQDSWQNDDLHIDEDRLLADNSSDGPRSGSCSAFSDDGSECYHTATSDISDRYSTAKSDLSGVGSIFYQARPGHCVERAVFSLDSGSESRGVPLTPARSSGHTHGCLHAVAGHGGCEVSCLDVAPGLSLSSDCRYTCHEHCVNSVTLSCKSGESCQILTDRLQEPCDPRSPLGRPPLLRGSPPVRPGGARPLSSSIAGQSLDSSQPCLETVVNLAPGAQNSPAGGSFHSGHSPGTSRAATLSGHHRSWSISENFVTAHQYLPGQGSGPAHTVSSAGQLNAPHHSLPGKGTMGHSQPLDQSLLESGDRKVTSVTSVSSSSGAKDTQVVGVGMTHPDQVPLELLDVSRQDEEAPTEKDETDSGYRSGTIPEDKLPRVPSQLTLDQQELQRKVAKFNHFVPAASLEVTGKESFQGFMKVTLNLIRPITMELGARPPSIYELLTREHIIEENTQHVSFYMPRDTNKSLHITSETTTKEVVASLLKKFRILDHPRKFAMYEQEFSDRNKLVRLRRLTDKDFPLRSMISFDPERIGNFRMVLQENETGEIVWEAFSLPELGNFLRVLDREEKETIVDLKHKYAYMKQYMERRLLELRGDGCRKVKK